ncbi:periplasmic heavy metal sensor [Siccirubricoccus phaeus]|uniref:periplasmic heavy metal sensor n=1 Tax=Siccirubricoccus phaeus TaxID=2595053 RepID=UPI0011F0D6E3|nr:periplasmic heavy metal sensor [Siccirubricoccus phaeus]
MRLGRQTILAALLGASVVVNLVLGGVLLAQPGRGHGGPSRGFERMIGRLEATLPETDRPRFREVLQAERPRYAEALQALRASRAEVDAAMLRQPFDPAALQQAMARSSERWVAFSMQFGEALSQALAAISPEGRARVAAAGSPGE